MIIKAHHILNPPSIYQPIHSSIASFSSLIFKSQTIAISTSFVHHRNQTKPSLNVPAYNSIHLHYTHFRRSISTEKAAKPPAASNSSASLCSSYQDSSSNSSSLVSPSSPSWSIRLSSNSFAKDTLFFMVDFGLVSLVLTMVFVLVLVLALVRAASFVTVVSTS